MAFTVSHLSESPHHSSSSSSQNLGFIHDRPLVFIPISNPRASPVYPPLEYLNSFTSPSSPSNSCSCLLLNYCNVFPSALATPQFVLQAKRLLFSDSVMSDSATPWTAACHAPLSMRFSRQEYWSGLPFPSPWAFSKYKPILSLLCLKARDQGKSCWAPGQSWQTHSTWPWLVSLWAETSAWLVSAHWNVSIASGELLGKVSLLCERDLWKKQMLSVLLAIITPGCV